LAGKKDFRKRWRRRWRTARFAVVRHVLIPALMPFVKLWMRSWRVRIETHARFAEMADTSRLSCCAVLHENMVVAMGALLHNPCGGPELRVATLVSPSRDGQLQADLVRALRQVPIEGSSSRGGAVGLIQLRRALRGGRVAAIAVDGPRGPRGVPKHGVLGLAIGTRARLYHLVCGAQPAFRLPTWDRSLLPLPFARVTYRLELFRTYDHDADPATEAAALQQAMIRSLEELGEPLDGIPGIDKAATE
jgi:lysophospholipid acyltransferase (LPLAT)-like uncharacterized protein